MGWTLQEWCECQHPDMPVQKCNNFRFKVKLGPLGPDRKPLNFNDTSQAAQVQSVVRVGLGEHVGSELKRIIRVMNLEDLAPDPASCSCEDISNVMNSWGCDGCEKNIDFITNAIEENANKVGILGKIVGAVRLVKARVWFNPFEPCRSLVRIAIDNVRRQSKRNKVSSMHFECAVTTCETRYKTYLPATIASLVKAGFERPMLFIDGSLRCANEWGLPQTVRSGPPLGPFGAWMTTAWSLFTATPTADRYIIFQDDVTASHGLREYLERVEYPVLGYCNLCTYPDNAKLSPEGHIGWFKTNQLGLGAQGLMFSREAMGALLMSKHLARRLVMSSEAAVKRRWKYIDGAVVTAMKESGWAEYAHSPSLIKHVGDVSSINNNPQPGTALFRGEDFDLRNLLK